MYQTLKQIFRHNAKRPPVKGRNSAARHARPRLEALEVRDVPTGGLLLDGPLMPVSRLGGALVPRTFQAVVPTYGVHIANGVVTVHGTSDVDQVFVRSRGDSVTVELRPLGKPVPYYGSEATRVVFWDTDGVARVLVDTYGRSQVSKVVFWGGAGDDQLTNDTAIPCDAYGEDGRDVFRGGAGADRFWGGAGDDELYGRDGDDELYGEGDADKVEGGNGGDVLRGGPGDDALHGGNPGDRALVLYYDERLAALNKSSQGDGVNFLYGEDGNDTLRAGLGGNNYLSGGNGNDELHGGWFHDVLSGDAGDDFLRSFAASTLFGGPGNDTLVGKWGGDTNRWEHFFGGDGDDTLRAGYYGSNSLNGEGGNDVLEGSASRHYADILDGGDGDDSLNGGADGIADTLIGRAGRDTFVQNRYRVWVFFWHAEDVLSDVAAAQGDRVENRDYDSVLRVFDPTA